jgi:hypothetical protein
MPSPISFLPVDTAPAQANATSSSAPEQTSGEPGVSFDTVLNKAAPCAGKPARTSVKGSARNDTDADATKSATSSENASSEEAPVDEKPSLLSAQELAALLAMIGAPVALQQPPPPAVPADFNLAGDTRSPDSDHINVDAEANFTAPMFTTGKDREVFTPPALGAQASDTNARFTLDAAASAEGLTARDLLKQGADVIDYQLAPSPETAASAATPESSTTARQPAAASSVSGLKLPPETLVAPEIAANAPSVAPARDQATAKSPAPASPEIVAQAQSKAVATNANGQPVDAVSARTVASQKAAGEKIAATSDSREPRTTSGVKSSISAGKYNFLNVDGKGVNAEQASVGTSAANWGVPMNLDSRPAAFNARLADGALWSIEGASGTYSNFERSAESSAPQAAAAPQAAQIVSEIRDIADGLWAVERNSVEVRFNFSENERLSVKVEYRDGVLQTTFRTDSPELRDTIAREWQSQIASASDARPYRVADPVFNTPPADARGFSLGGDSSRQQRQAEQSGNAPHTFATTSGRGPSSSSVAAAPVTSFSRPDTALHLHTFA